MKYNVIGYFLSEGFRNVFKNKKSTFSCLGVMCATMLMFGLFFVIGQNINNAIKDLEKEQGMQVFMYPEATDEQIAKLKEDLGKIVNVTTLIAFPTLDNVSIVLDLFCISFTLSNLDIASYT